MKFYETMKGRATNVAWIDESGDVIDSSSIARDIVEFHKELIGKHICEQIDGIGLLDSFERGSTPYQLPWTFV